MLEIVAVIIAVIAIICVYIISQEKSSWNNVHISSQTGKVIVITGANSGLGYYTAEYLAKKGATVIVACRSKSKCDKAVLTIKEKSGNENIHPMILDLASLSSVRQFAEEVKQKFPQIDVLINNAGISTSSSNGSIQLTTDGVEEVMATNHFGHFLLTALLYPLITMNGKIINHSSFMHFVSYGIPYDNLKGESNQNPNYSNYYDSKLANLLFTYALNERLDQSNNPRNITCISVHPGFTDTNIFSEHLPIVSRFANLMALPVECGALPLIITSTTNGMKASVNNYFGPRFIAWGYPTITSTSSLAADRNAQKKLWEVSEKITDQRFIV